VPEPEPIMLQFYRSVRPHVGGWEPIARLAPDVAPTRDLGRNLVSWVLGCAMVYLALFGTGKFILGTAGEGLLMLIGAAACAYALYANLARQGWSSAT
jgi:hypothetical protein